MNECYKVVRVTEKGTNVSFAGFGQGIDVRYLKSRFVGPTIKGTPLFVFKTIDHAIYFAQSYSLMTMHYAVYRCKYKNEYHIQGVFLPSAFYGAYHFNEFWKNFELGVPYNARTNLPLGTILVDEIRLIEKVFDLKAVKP